MNGHLTILILSVFTQQINVTVLTFNYMLMFFNLLVKCLGQMFHHLAMFVFTTIRDFIAI
jgi:hypothetical protein